jgi:hypothetical protein
LALLLNLPFCGCCADFGGNCAISCSHPKARNSA